MVQWDKEDCADMGIVKVDLLGLGMLAVLQEAITIVNTAATEQGRWPRHGSRSATAIDLAHLPPDDPVVYQMLQEADTVGLFQVESRAQMATLPRLKPTCFYDLVVEVAIIRPGPIVGQMVHPYLARRRGAEPVEYAHPLTRADPEAHTRRAVVPGAVAADGDGGGRLLGGRGRGTAARHGLQALRGTHAADRGAAAIGHGRARHHRRDGRDDPRSIASFALYGFPESHAASFALIVYASAYLKAYYPAAFYTALLNNQPLGFYHPATLIKDAQRHGVRFLPVDVQQSTWACHITPDGAVRLGFCMVQGLREEVGRRLETRLRDERRTSNPPRARGAHRRVFNAERRAKPPWSLECPKAQGRMPKAGKV